MQKYLANDTNAAFACFATGHCLDDGAIAAAVCQDLSIVQMWGAQDWQKCDSVQFWHMFLAKVCWHLKTTWFGASLDGWSLHHVMHSINGCSSFLDSVWIHPFPDFVRVCQHRHHEEREIVSTGLRFKRDTKTSQPCSVHFMGKTTQSFGLESSKVF